MKTIDLWKADGDVKMHIYEPEVKRGDGAVIVFTGGGYVWRAPHEAEPYALKINEMGLWSFVVDYRVAPNRYPAPLLDARRALATVRENAKEYGIDTGKIAVMGSSAGGHLAALCSTLCDDGDRDALPNAQILCYPVTDIYSHKDSYKSLLGENTEEHKRVCPTDLADKDTPPAFIWHTSSDSSVDVKGSYRYAARLSELGIPVEMHIYPVGGHGLGLANGLYDRAAEPYVQRWIEDLERWLGLIGWINQ